MPWTFLTDTMSLPELRKCATRSYRFRHALFSPRKLELSSRTVTLHYSGKWHEGVEHDPRAELYLVPGGRWLLSIARTSEASFVVCWDLALGDTRISPVAVYQLSERNHNAPQIFVQSDAVSDRLVVLVRDSSDAWRVLSAIVLYYYS